MSETYFRRVHADTPTRFWINNPTTSEARLAMDHGAFACTTNPTYAGKMLASPEMRPLALAWVKEALAQTGDTSQAAALVQRSAVSHLLGLFLPLYKAAPGKMGFVSLQSDPLLEDDPKNIIDEALACKQQLGPNYIAKIPVTGAGLVAIDAMIRRNIPVIATEIMSVAQAKAACEVYQRASQESGHAPAYFVTNIAGIFDDCLRMQLEAGKIDIDPDILCQAGVVLGRRQYRVMKQRGYPGVMLGGGARGLHHFTEFVGGDAHITINWKNSAQTLIEENRPVVSRMDTPTEKPVLEALLSIPDFQRAYQEDGLSVDEFATFAPVELFRSQFVDGWKALLDEIETMKGGK